MSRVTFRCTRCDTVYTASPSLLECSRCGSTLDAFVQPVEGLAGAHKLPGVFRWWSHLPLHDPSAVTSLGEGNTPLIPLPSLARRFGLSKLYAKLEGCNPTGSFKDRGAAVMVSALREQGITELVEDSSGNAGSAVAAYCARAGMRATVFVPESTPLTKLGQARAYGAVVRPVPGPRDAAAVAARKYAREHTAVYASHNLSPYPVHGMKSFAFELAEQLPGVAIDHIVLPVGNGSLLLGCAMGYAELRAQNPAINTPQLHAIQTEEVRPLVAAFKGETWLPENAGRTVAGGIAVTRPPRAHQIVAAVKGSGGQALAVEEHRIVAWQRELAESEGIYAEPTAAAAFVGLEMLVKQGVIKSGDTVLVPVTGSGLKDSPPGPGLDGPIIGAE